MLKYCAKVGNLEEIGSIWQLNPVSNFKRQKLLNFINQAE
jgi:hypothetical protein